ncbi:MAG: hypothetical protein HEQ27_17015 [Dolichospermum sp. JUN01]|jgi:hypothetical protein|uniref:DUF6232 family protein n=1 Tax=Anabaena sp. AL09 TaxID=1710891 RepID=UPI0007FBC319|nr:DUF6232 family protein [Anabaena sp. AL09]MBO1058117.1 hypothetical protein [Dolichospermum sp. JUN01]MCE2697005.1 DUF6232 family protein [Anabaena sp. 49633_E8]MDJ0501497.1 DUF6232 family protein [Nostocales cyanobacterium LE14-WE4]MCE2699756.1 DUF6232 family protein [Anabaena sp. 49633_E8]OBQ03473.1 MAG: hypothetical protein AN490_17320 [Anabaena sp. AL09]
MLSQFLPDNPSNTTEIKTTILKIRGKTLIYGNVVYQIHNISSIGLVDLTTTKPIPKLYWSLLVIGILFLLIPNAQPRILGFLLLVIVSWLFYQHNLKKTTERYGMTIYANSGTKTILVSRSEDFIKGVIMNLYNAMNSEELKAINFNFETLDMSSSSVKIGTNIGAPVVTGSVSGDVVSQV